MGDLPYDTGDNAFVLISACFVMFMTPGVGFFYGGMVNKKNLLSTIAYCMLVFSVGSIVWALIGFSLSFGEPTSAYGFIGDCTYCGLKNLHSSTPNPNFTSFLPPSTFFVFQMMFAAITPAIFIGSIVGKIRMSFLISLTVCWVIIVYSPIAYWNWNYNGWLFKLGTIDFAGGNVIHISSGFAGLASAIYLGKDKVQKQTSSSISLTLIGVAILWMGWFGFNGGSALASNINATAAIINSHLAACAAGLSWASIQYFLQDRPSILGWCCGSICGLVAITPGAGYVSLWSSIVIGIIGGALSYLFCHFKSKYFQELSDTLDVFGCHGVCGIWGGIATGLFATNQINDANKKGLFYGDPRQLGVNVLAIVSCALYSFVMTLILYFLIARIVEPRVSQQIENQGLDHAVHGEENDPLTQKEVIKIIRSVNNFNTAGNQIIANMIKAKTNQTSKKALSNNQDQDLNRPGSSNHFLPIFDVPIKTDYLSK